MRRKPMPEIPESLQALYDATTRLRRAEANLDRERRDFADAIYEAHRAGASYALIGRVVGLTRQRIAAILKTRAEERRSK
jgi:hypothetical protein